MMVLHLDFYLVLEWELFLLVSKMSGIVLVFRELLSKLRRYSIAIGPKCFRCFILILSGPVELLFFAVFMADKTCSVEICKYVDCSCFVCLSIFLFSFLVVYFVGFVNCLLNASAICFEVIRFLFPKVIVLL